MLCLEAKTNGKMRTSLICLRKDGLHAWVIVLEGIDIGNGQIMWYIVGQKKKL